MRQSMAGLVSAGVCVMSKIDNYQLLINDYAPWICIACYIIIIMA